MKKCTYKEFLKGEFSILVTQDTIKDTLEKLSQTNLKWRSGDNPNEINPLNDRSYEYLGLVAKNGSLSCTTDLLWYAPLITMDQLVIEEDDIKPHDFIGLCVWTEADYLCNVGELYYFKNGIATWNDGDSSARYSSIYDLNNKNTHTFQMVEIKEVKRKAKTGEYVKIVNADNIPQTKGVDDYKNGDILQIIDDLGFNVTYSNKTSSNNLCKELRDYEYVVLEGYREVSLFKIGDMVKIVGTGKCFDTYEEWFEETGNLEYKSHYVINKIPCQNRQYKIVANGYHIKHLWHPNGVYAIQDLDTSQVFLVSDEGLKKID